MQTYTIYALLDPRTPGGRDVRYVGLTIYTAEHRASHHVKAAIRIDPLVATPKEAWLRELAALGHAPTAMPLQLVPGTFDRTPGNVAERWWIAEMLRQGHALTNDVDWPSPPTTRRAGAITGRPQTALSQKRSYAA